jgi:hypothetical protein
LVKRSSPIIVSWLIIVLILSILNVSAVFAQSEMPAAESPCATCHENLYLLHDTGKWYCMCKRQADCTVCHAGQADSFEERLAHQGLIANPIRDNPAACQSCHGDNADQYIQRFTLIAGVSQPRPTPPAYAPAALYIEAPVEPAGEVRLAGKAYQAWQLIGLGVVAGLLAGVFLFGCRCWKDDRAQGRI